MTLECKGKAETLCVQEHFEGVLGWLQQLRLSHWAQHKIQHKATNSACMGLGSGSLLDSLGIVSSALSSFSMLAVGIGILLRGVSPEPELFPYACLNPGYATFDSSHDVVV